MNTSKRTTVGTAALAVALVGLFGMSFLPTSFVVQQPGPVYNTIGTAESADGEEMPLIEVHDAESYETTGSLDLTTVQVLGDRERTPSWFELAMAWFDRSKAVVPLDSVYPEGVTTEDREEQNAAMMVDSQAEATAAALTELGYDVGGETEISVVDVTEGAPATGRLEPGDIVLTADGEPIADTDDLRLAIAAGDGESVEITYERDGEQGTTSITPTRASIDGEDSWAIGVLLTPMTTFDFPIDVTIQLDDVGGPSAGTMFALGIIDTLTEEDMTGGENIAGTGTIDAEGTVGAIGGIRQKLYGARDAGAEWFLAPADNCEDVVGHVPDGLSVFAVATLSQAEDAVQAIASGQTDELATCESP
ncbi:PDZ domain-containing protein [Microbacterium halotolerans]|uniref:YlbL family protein n=1 Tax=Microbacterium halotolerans TaxID=246613 RepID=UPI001F0959ED|nr:PDZ domain-containing protein [Microbacterium halotolerans]